MKHCFHQPQQQIHQLEKDVAGSHNTDPQKRKGKDLSENKKLRQLVLCRDHPTSAILEQVPHNEFGKTRRNTMPCQQLRSIRLTTKSILIWTGWVNSAALCLLGIALWQRYPKKLQWRVFPRGSMCVLAHISFAILDMLQYLVQYLVQYFGMLVYCGIYTPPSSLRHLRGALVSSASLGHACGTLMSGVFLFSGEMYKYGAFDIWFIDSRS